MPTQNPDWKSADEVIVPPDAEFGWVGNIPDERRALSDLEDAMPYYMREKGPEEFEPEALKQWNDFQESKGRFPGSADWTLIDQFTAKKDLSWRPQIIGSCVMSNTLPIWVVRLMVQIVLLGRMEEYLGTNEDGPENFAPYGPYTYGIARRKANMRRGDGLYCEPMAWALMQGILPCSLPKLIELCKRLGVNGPNDYPEPQSKSVYRDWGNWAYLDDFTPYADYPVTEAPQVKSVDQLLGLLDAGKPAFVCSNIAIKKIGTHKDGFSIHAKDPRNNWAHNMNFQGKWVASDGKIFVREGNTSWGPSNIYNIPVEEVDGWFRRGLLSSVSIGNILGPKSAPSLA